MMVQVIGVGSLVALMRLGERSPAQRPAATEPAAGQFDDLAAAFPEDVTMYATSRATGTHGRERH